MPDRNYKKNTESEDLALFAKFMQKIQKHKNYSAGRHSAFAHYVLKELVNFLDVDRGGIWLIDEAREKLVPMWCYSRQKKQFHKGKGILIKDNPIYFNHILRHQQLNAPDALVHPAVQEFVDNYLIPQQVKSLMDMAILEGKNIVGILCLESCEEKRTWTNGEMALVQGISSILSYVFLLAKKRALYEEKISWQEKFENLNATLKNVLDIQRTGQRKIEENLAHRLVNQIAPIMQKLRKKLSKDDVDLEMLQHYLGQITSPKMRIDEELKKLSTQECNVIELIKYGNNSKSIAKKLKLSDQTVQTHKKNIRRKLNLKGKNINLETYLLENNLH